MASWKTAKQNAWKNWENHRLRNGGCSIAMFHYQRVMDIYIYQAPTKGRITIYHYHKVGVLLILDIFWSFCVLIPNLGDHKPFLWETKYCHC